MEQSDADFLRAAIDQHFITMAQAEECRRLQHELRDRGDRDASIPALLREKGYMTDAQINAVASSRGTIELGGHRVLHTLRSGEGTKTFSAEHIASGKSVVLSVVDKALSQSESYRQQFNERSRVIATLRHPNLPTLISTGEDRSRLYVSTEYQEGLTVARMLSRQGRLSVQGSVEVVIQAVRALEAASQHGLVHGALSPEQILIAKDSTVKLYGVETPPPPAAERAPDITGEHGSRPHYLSPEVAQKKEADVRSDVFSLGAILYHMVTGTEPFDGVTTAEVLRAVETVPPPRPEEHNPKVTPPLAATLRKMMARDPEERYQSIAELLSDLEAARDGKIPASYKEELAKSTAEKAAAPPQPQPQPKPLKTSRPFVVGAALVGLAAAILLYFFLFGSPSDSKPGSRPRGTAGASPRRKPKAKDGSPADGGSTADGPAVAGKGEAEKGPFAGLPKPVQELLRQVQAQAKQNPGKYDETIARYEAVAKKFAADHRVRTVVQSLIDEVRAQKTEAAIGAIQEYADQHPTEYETIISRYQAIREAATSPAVKAKLNTLIAGVRAAKKKEFDEYTARREQAKQRSAKAIADGRYGDAVEIYREFERAHQSESLRYKAARDAAQQIIYIEGLAGQAMDEIVRRADELSTHGYYADAKKEYEKVVKDFGLPKLVGRAEAQIDFLTPLIAGEQKRRETARRREQNETYRSMMSEIDKLARKWKYDSAQAKCDLILALSQVKGTEFATKVQARKEDLALLRAMQKRLIAELNGATPKVPTARFSRRRLAGEISRATDGGLEIESEKMTLVVPWEALSLDEAGKLAHSLRSPLSEADRIGLGLLHVQFGDLQGAKRHFTHVASKGVDVRHYRAIIDELESDQGEPKEARAEEPGKIFLQAKAFYEAGRWEEALQALCRVRVKYGKTDYAIRAKLDEIDDLIRRCRSKIAEIEFREKLQSGKWVSMLQNAEDLRHWRDRFLEGDWAVKDGTLIGKVSHNRSGELLLHVDHEPQYEMEAECRVADKEGGYLRLASDGRLMFDFWINAKNPAKVGLYVSKSGGPGALDKEIESRVQNTVIQPDKWYAIKAQVTNREISVFWENKPHVTIRNRVRQVKEYGFLVSVWSEIHFRNIRIRLLKRQ